MKKLCFVAALVSAVAFAQEQQAPEPPCGGPGSCEQGKPCKFGRKGPRKGQRQCGPEQCGQEQCGPQQGPKRGPGFMGQMGGPWVLGFFSDPEKLSKAGVTDAAVCEKIAAKAAELKAKGDFTYEGSDSEYGLYIESVNGLKADYNVDKAYWAIYVNGEYGQLGADTQPVNDGDSFKLAYEK